MYPENHLNGTWIGVEPEGGTVRLHHEGRHVRGDGTGGRSHPTLTNHFSLEGHDACYAGSYKNEEGVVRGSGKAEIKIIDHNRIELFWDGDWAGGGSSGHTSGRSILRRQG
jgi:hypothetical protein